MKDKVLSAALALIVVGLLVTLTVQAPAGQKKDELLVSNFRVEIDGVVVGHFKEVSGLECRTEVIEFRPANDPSKIQLLPGATRCGPLVLKRGLSDGPELWNWYEEVINGNVDRKSGSVIMFDTKGIERARFNFEKAWPAKWTGPSLDASKNEIAIEEVLVVFESGDWVTG